MGITGKGFFIWKIKDCEHGDPKTITKVAQSAGLTHVLLKIADGAFPYNVNRDTKEDYVKPLVKELRSAGISVWGWHYVYGNYPIDEANIAVKRMKELDLTGYVIDAEWEYKEPGKSNAASTYMKILRKGFPEKLIALSSYRFPSYHPQLPWKTFLEYCDFNMPQVYWEQAHNPDPQLARTVREFKAMSPSRPVIATGPTYRAGGWVPTKEDLLEFLKSAKTNNLPAVNFFSWDECRPAYPGLWQTIEDFSWDKPISENPPDISQIWIDALNNANLDRICDLYTNHAVHINSERTIQGKSEIRNWYTKLLNNLLPNGKFNLTGYSGKGSSRHITWTGKAKGLEVTNGNDTIGLINNKILYHYSNFSGK